MFSARFKTAQFLVCSGYVMNGSVVSGSYQRRWYELNGAQHPWSLMERLVRRPLSYRGVPWRACCGNLTALMEYHAELMKLDTLMEYHEELVRVDIFMEYHEKSVMVGLTHGVS